MGTKRLFKIPGFIFARKIFYAFAFALFLASLGLTGIGVYLIHTRPLLYWTDWDLFGFQSLAHLECPKRLSPFSSADICLTLKPPADAPDPIGSSPSVIFVTQLEGSFDPQTKLPLGKSLEFEQWFKPDTDQPLRWCSEVKMADFLDLGGHPEGSMLIVVTAPVDFGARSSQQVIGSCSIFLQDPLAAGTILIRLAEFFLAATNLVLAALFWRWSFRSLHLLPRDLWKILLAQTFLGLVVVVLFLGLVGPFDLETGTLLFTSAPGVYHSDLRAYGWGILVATFLLASVFALLGKRLSSNQQVYLSREQRNP